MPLVRQAAREILATRGEGELPPLTLAEARWLRRFRRWLAHPAAGPLAGAFLAA